ncbi:hypothetical protein GUITHDRAFT_104993 [Guillardia theta CCMP2712]|uniref:F-box domain-containing protein n=1 Tax=Guillardia theta (strain CCMP2712) TaxID=905079 RepID=L1JMP2_GUITC|nr:hypothetical protein GUITHDRAFT_104993 [Guillardia theta CCMP2712]EKX49465.1 hypothetical protein GUITHDRAFT_104993 [Guillardia theta CCMP2712]|eukprot:XP_005836445.1 hypothetical protein GUITHDRAFT_104993 [Guillardia theta CCMP2712]
MVCSADESERAEQDELSKDVLLIVFKRLPLDVLRHVLLVCRHWRVSALDPSLPAWHTLSPETFCMLVPEHHNHAIHNVERARHSHLASRPPCAKSRRCTELREADLRTVSHLDNEALMHVAKHCSRLSRLRIHDVMSLGSKITSVGLIHLTRICSNLTFLDISYTVCSDKALEYIGNLPELRSLHMQGCSRIKGQSLPYLLSQCTKLEEINLYRTSVTASIAAKHLSKAMRTRPLRVNMLNPDDLPSAVDLWCGMCSKRLYSRLQSYVTMQDPTSKALFHVCTNISPEWMNVVICGLVPIRYSCINRCHAACGGLMM